jgi:hypothetical protein
MRKAVLGAMVAGVMAAGVVAAPVYAARDVEHFQFPLPVGCGGVTADNVFDVTTVSDKGYPKTVDGVFSDQGRYVAKHNKLRFAGRFTDADHETITLWDGQCLFVTMHFDSAGNMTSFRCFKR